MLLTVVKFLTVFVLCDALTMKQIKQTGKTLRKSCQPKNNVDDEIVDGIKEGKFVEDNDLMCYMACIAKMTGMVKGGKLNYDSAVKQAEMLLPDDIKGPAKQALAGCKKILEEPKELCLSAFVTIKCIYNQNKEIFYFP